MNHWGARLLTGVCLVAAEMLIPAFPTMGQEEQVVAAPLRTPDANGRTTLAVGSAKISEPRDLQEADRSNGVGMPLLRNLWTDQKDIWTSPRRLHSADGSWLFPIAVATGGLLATDTSSVNALSSNTNTLNRFRALSNYGVASLVGAGGGLYLWGRLSHDDHQREAGMLAGEAAVDSLAVTTTLQYSFGRARPQADQGRGQFFQRGTSFPSDHAAVAWSIASVLAHEYPGPLTKLLVYGLATGVSVSRVGGKEHFPSDVFVGSTIGWLIGRQIYRSHHDVTLGGTGWSAPSGDDLDNRRSPQSMGSPSVPLDSWVYAALEKLAALRAVNTAITGLKPWTRLECARLTEEAGEALQENQFLGPHAAELQARLQQEFAYELKLLGGERNLTANLDSLYTRAVSVSGTALTDSYHFGQTISFDFGRPFERGTSEQTGGSFSAAAGPMALSVRAEFQHAPSAPAFPSAALSVISLRDRVPLTAVPSGAMTATNRLELLDAYVSVNLNNWQLSVGRQSLLWSPGPSGSMLWSNNIEPVNMVQLTNPEPFRLPGFLGHLGPVRTDQFFGRLTGHPYVPRPFIYGQKINLKPFSFLELGFGRTVTIGGTGGIPLTTGNFAHSFLGAFGPRTGSVPGDSHAEMDWIFYVPKVRNYLVLYGDSYADDDGIPIQNPARNPWHPGLYITRIPKIPKLDFHIEGVSTEQPGIASCSSCPLANKNQGDFNYWNQTYRDGYTNGGFLIGNPVGRDGRTIQAWFTYWFSPRNTLQFTYKHNTVASDFMPGGAAWQDYGLRNEANLPNGFYVKSELQYEHITRYPILFSGSRTNITAILEVGFSPREKR